MKLKEYDEWNYKEECHFCIENEKKIANASEFFQGLLDQLYGEFDEKECERMLDELGGYLGVRIPLNVLNVKRKGKNGRFKE